MNSATTTHERDNSGASRRIAATRESPLKVIGINSARRRRTYRETSNNNECSEDSTRTCKPERSSSPLVDKQCCRRCDDPVENGQTTIDAGYRRVISVYLENSLIPPTLLERISHPDQSQDWGKVVRDEADTVELSERSATTNQEQSFPVARSLEESSVSGIFEGRDVDKAFLDFGEFVLDKFIVLQTVGVKFRQELEAFFLFTFANEISWTLGHQTERHIDEDDYSSGAL